MRRLRAGQGVAALEILGDLVGDPILPLQPVRGVALNYLCQIVLEIQQHAVAPDRSNANAAYTAVLEPVSFAEHDVQPI